MNNELAKIFSELAAAYKKPSVDNDAISKLFARAAELGANVGSTPAQIHGNEQNAESLQDIILDASNDDIPAILKLKKLAKEDRQAKAALKNLYYDGDQKKTFGTMILYDGLKYIDEGEFKNLKNVTKIVLPESLVGIDNNAFEGCINLEEVYFPQTLTSIGASAFQGCRSLKQINLPDSVTSIGDSAFSQCTNLKEVVLSKGLTYISNGAFSGCSSLPKIEIPDSVNSIGDSAFAHGTNLKEIKIPDSVTSIGKDIFFFSEVPTVTCSEKTKRFLERNKNFSKYSNTTWNIID